MHCMFPTQSANEQRFANVKPYIANIDNNSNFYQFVLYICNHF